MQRAAKRKTLCLTLIASALIFWVPAIASSHSVLHLENRAEIFLPGGQNRVERPSLTLETAPSYYDDNSKVASDSSVAPRSAAGHYTDFADEAAEIMENAARSRGLNPNQQLFNMALSRKRALERLESLTPRVEEHIQKIINNPASRDVPHWQGEIKAWLDTMENAAQYTGKATSEEWLFKIRSWRLLLDASK